MNQTHVSKWNPALGAWVACSELARRAGKWRALPLVLVAGAVHAAGVCPGNFSGTAGSVVYLPGDSAPASAACDSVPANAAPLNVNLAGGYLLTRSRLNTNGVTVVNVGGVNIVSNVPNTNDFGGLGNQYALAPMTLNVASYSADITRGLVTSMGSHSGVDLNIAGNTNLKITSAYPASNFSGGAETYGAVAGSSVVSGEGNAANNGLFTTVTMSNLTLNQSTNEVAALWFNPILNSGLRAIQGATNGNGTSGKIVVTGLLDMTLKGRRIEGIYVSGAATGAGSEAVSQVVLNNSTIVLDNVAATRVNNSSSAIKIGKARAVGTGKGLVVSNGFLSIDASKAVGYAIKMSVNGSRLEANNPGSSADILANKSALAIGVDDWGTTAQATNIYAALGQAKVRTVSTTEPLLRVDGGQQGVDIWFDRNSDLVAAPNGYLVDIVNANSQGTSSATTRFDHGTTVSGLTNKLASATLNVSLDNGSTWNLVEKTNGDKTATYTRFDMAAGATLNGFKPGAAAFVMNGPLSATASTTALADNENNDLLTVQGDYSASAATLTVDACLGDSAAQSDVLAVTGATSGDTVVQVSPTAGAGCGGADTTATGNGILVVRVDGNSAGTFSLAGGSVTQGNFTYTLNKVGNNWYLQSKAAVGQLVINMVVTSPAGTPHYSGPIAFSVICTGPGLSDSGSIAVANSAGSSSPIGVAAGSSCTVTQVLPLAPAGYTWGVPSIVQAPAIAASGTTTATITNSLNAITPPNPGGDAPKPVPLDAPWALAALAALLGLGGLRKRH